MIPKKTLIKTIEDFDIKFNLLRNDLKNRIEPHENHLKYFEMTKAWNKLEDAVESYILPFTNKS